MVRVILFCMIIPYIVLSAVLIGINTSHNRRQIEETVVSSLESAGNTIVENIYSAIEMSRQASYDGVIKSAYESYLKDHDENAMYRAVSAYLSKTYKYSKTVSNSILLYRAPMSLEYYTYSNVAGATYANIEEFKNNAAEAVRLAAEDLDTKARLVFIDGHLYVIRNIVLSSYEPFATFVTEVNTYRLFESLDSIIWGKGGLLALEDEAVYRIPEKTQAAETEALMQKLKRLVSSVKPPVEGRVSVSYASSEDAGVMMLKVNGQMFSCINTLDRNEMIRSGMAFLSAYVVVFITLIPLLIATFYYFYANISRPVDSLMKGSEQIRKGHFGYTVEPFEKNTEMAELVDTFNHMSVSLEESFKRIYVEEIAERDAKLKALQSQINPHFLNNTLEIINWKARMNGNDDVSDMITALSVMMNAALNRNNEMFVTLQEELSYVDAYLYIIKERFGNKFTFTKNIDQTLLDHSVPRLIIQPIIENAVEHGGRDGKRIGDLTIRKQDRDLLITVRNNGTLSEKDREKIALLLKEEDAGTSLEALDRQSIGIRNVHLRLRMIYGNGSGLTIESRDDMTVCTILIRQSKQEQTNSDTEIQKYPSE